VWFRVRPEAALASGKLTRGATGGQPTHRKSLCLDAVRDLTFDRQYGRYGYLVEADITGVFDPIDQAWLVDMLRVRIDDRAVLNLIRTWWKAGILDTDGQVIHPETGTPQGGTVSPVLAKVYVH